MSFVSSDPEFEKPYVNHSLLDGKAPPFYLRLLVCVAQLLIYHDRFRLPKECLRACYEYCKQYESEMEESYRRKVFFEFVKAMRDKDTVEEDKTAPETKADSDSDDDAVLEEMLNAEHDGYGEFEDDFDELDDDRSENSSEDVSHKRARTLE